MLTFCISVSTLFDLIKQITLTIILYCQFFYLFNIPQVHSIDELFCKFYTGPLT